jgi:hypothetical protein
MRGFRNIAIAAAAASALMLAATPSFAVTWTCSAKNASGKSYSASANGPRTLVVRERAGAKALTACRAGSAAPLTCYIVGCHT